MNPPTSTTRQAASIRPAPQQATAAEAVVVVRLGASAGGELPAWPLLPLECGTMADLLEAPAGMACLLVTDDGKAPEGIQPTGSSAAEGLLEVVRPDQVAPRLNHLAGPDTPLWQFDNVIPNLARLSGHGGPLADGAARPLTLPGADRSEYVEEIDLDEGNNVKAVRRTYGDAVDGPAARQVGTLGLGPGQPARTGRALPLDPGDVVPLPRNLGEYLDLVHHRLAETAVRRHDQHWINPRPGVYVHTTAQVDPRALLAGPLVVGPGAHVARCSLLGPVVVGPAAVVESFATVSDAVVLERALVEGRAYVCQSVVGPGQTLASGKTLDYQVLHRGETREGTGRPPALPKTVEARAGQSTWRHISEAAYRLVKRTVDIAGALVGLALTLPFYPLIALIIKLDNPGPVFFRHVRQTRGGRPFDCLKFRSMRSDAEAIKAELQKANQCDGPQFHMDRDPRLTRFGRWMRRRNIDELPQLINVLLGHMSLVGPRPSPDGENQLCPAWRRARLSVRPGITGLWQVCRRDRAGGDFHQWIYYDTEYVQNRSLWLDARILLATFKLVLLNWSDVGPDEPGADVSLPYGLTSIKPLVGWGVALAVVWLAAWWTAAADLWRTWMTDADYSHGPLIPLIAAGMVWYKRDALKGVRIHPTFIGAVLLGFAFACRFVGLYYWYGSLERISMVLGLAGLVMMVYGMDLFRRVAWPLAFLLLMFPLPARVDQAIMLPLQAWGAKMGKWMIELAGIEVARLGNTLIVEGRPMEVARACSGLRLVYAFMALAFCVAYVSKRVAWEKVLIAASSLPIAVAINAFRIFAIAAVLSVSGWRWSIGDVHDAWNWVMMPLALLALLLETWILKKLFLDEKPRWSFNA